MTDTQAAADTPTDTPPTKKRIRLYFQEGERTPDRRFIKPQAIKFDRQPPFPIRLQTTQPEQGGHAGAVISGVINKIGRFGNTIVAEGFLDLTQEAGRQSLQLAENGTMQTWSPDLGDADVEAADDSRNPTQKMAVFSHAIFLGATLCAIPALGSAVFELLDDSGTVTTPAPTREAIMASMEDDLIHLSIDELADRNFPTDTRKKYAKRGIAMPDGSYPIPDRDALRRAIRSIGRAKPADRPKVISHIRKRARALKANDMLGPALKKVAASSALLACAASSAPPAEYFDKPELTELQRWVTITPEGRIFGHLAGHDECHIGFSNRCITISEVIPGGFDYCNGVGHVLCADGEEVATCPLPVIGGHADEDMAAAEARAYYDEPGHCVADVVYYEDEFGISYSGVLRPTATEEQVYALRASGVSLDAREIDGSLRLLGGCCVNRPGFPKVRARLVASGDEDVSEARITALVAAGGRPLPDPELVEELSEELFATPTNDELTSRIEHLEALVAAAGIEDMAFDRLTASVTSE